MTPPDLSEASNHSGPRARHRAPDAGFGLVEALVAILVFAVGLLAVAGMTLSVAGQSRASTYRTDQTITAQEILEHELDRGYAGLTVGTNDTTVAIDARSYDVRIVVTDQGPRARRVELTVSGHENTAPTTLSGLVHKPRDVPEEYVP